MPETLRLFAAAPLPGAIRHKLKQWGDANKNDFPFQKWAHPDDLHITLFFMGDTDERRVPDIIAALREGAAAFKPLTLRLGGLGTFGPPAAPSILWTGLTGDKESLTSVQRMVQSRLVSLGFKSEDKAFRPHITLARRYKGQRPWMSIRDPLLKNFEPEGAEWSCERITLYLSHLGRSPMYEVLGEFPLRGAGVPVP